MLAEAGQLTLAPGVDLTWLAGGEVDTAYGKLDILDKQVGVFGGNVVPPKP
jgi:hypothetical protein